MPNSRLRGNVSLAQAVLDVVPVHIAVLDHNGVIVEVNAAWRRFALDNACEPGVMPANCDVGGNYLTVCDAVRGADAATAAGAASGIRRVLAGEIAEFFLEYPCHSLRQPRWFLMRVNRLAAGQGVVMAHMDMTQRKLAELALHDSELRLSLALEASGDGLWDWDLQTGETYLSPGYFSLSKYSPNEGKYDLAFFQRLVHPEDWPSVYAIIEAHLRGETEISEVEYRMIRADGTQIWILGRGRVVARDASGKPLRMIGYITDISGYKGLEQSLRNSEARLRGVLEDQTELISRILPDGTFLYANPVYCRFFGKAMEEVVGRRWQPVAHPDDLPMILAQLAKLSVENPVVVIENRVYAGDGSLHWMQFVNRGFFDGAGTLLEIQSVGRDITERVALQQEREALFVANSRLSQELIRLQETERAVLAKELHDELSQEIVAIRAHAGAIERRGGRQGSTSLKDAAAITEAAGRIYDISHRLMDGLRPQMLDSARLGDVLRGLLTAWSERHPDLRVIARISDTARECPEALRIQIYRILQETLANVTQHARASAVRVYLGVREGQPERVLRLVVRDNGQGMDLGQPVFGFGLSIMRERARMIGGDLAVSSRPGQGVRVAVETWLDRPSGGDDAHADGQPGQSRGVRHLELGLDA
jgi:PAS domain S-box-containing protein